MRKYRFALQPQKNSGIEADCAGYIAATSTEKFLTYNTSGDTIQETVVVPATGRRYYHGENFWV